MTFMWLGATRHITAYLRERGLAAGPGRAGAPGGCGSLFSRKVRRNSRRRSPSPPPRSPGRSHTGHGGGKDGGGCGGVGQRRHTAAASPPPRAARSRRAKAALATTGPAWPHRESAATAPRPRPGAPPPSPRPGLLQALPAAPPSPNRRPPAAAQEGSLERPQGACCPPPRPVPLGARGGRNGGKAVYASPVPHTTRAPPAELRGCCRTPAVRRQQPGAALEAVLGEGVVSFLSMAICDGDRQWHPQSTVFLFHSKLLPGEIADVSTAVKWIYLGIRTAQLLARLPWPVFGASVPPPGSGERGVGAQPPGHSSGLASSAFLTTLPPPFAPLNWDAPRRTRPWGSPRIKITSRSSIIFNLVKPPCTDTSSGPDTTPAAAHGRPDNGTTGEARSTERPRKGPPAPGASRWFLGTGNRTPLARDL
ncbi:uncharacterized protein LJ264_009000 [Porphyrio hochstetteri]